MSLVSRIITVCERRSELVESVYQNLAFGIVTFGATAIALNKTVSYKVLAQLSWVAFIPLFVIPFIMHGRIQSLSQAGATSLFYAYAVSYGVAFAAPLLMYSLTQITIALGMTAVMFLIALYAARHMNIDSADVKLFSVSLIVLLVMSLLNVFLRMPLLELAICVVGMVAIVGLSAYEISEFESLNLVQGADTGKLSILISLSLLNKVITIFIYALRFLAVLGIGNNRRD